MLPPEASAVEAQQAITDEFAFFGDWSERYQYLIDLGRRLPPMPEDAKSEANRVQGCQSKVWITATGDATRLEFDAASDSSIVAGLVYLALRVYTGRSAADILATQPEYIERIGLSRHLSPTRSNGLSSVLQFIQSRAAAMADAGDPGS